MPKEDVMTALDEIAARADAATEGPWWLHGDGESICYQFHNGDTQDYDRLAVATYPQTADAQFIAHAREDVPRLVSALRSVEALAAEWQSHADRLRATSEYYSEDVRQRLLDGATDDLRKADEVLDAIREALG